MQRAHRDGRGQKAHNNSGGLTACRATNPLRASRTKVGTDLPDFALFRAHQLLVEVYGDYLHQNCVMYLENGISINTISQCLWFQLTAQLVIWYELILGGMG